MWKLTAKETSNLKWCECVVASVCKPKKGVIVEMKNTVPVFFKTAVRGMLSSKLFAELVISSVFLKPSFVCQ